MKYNIGFSNLVRVWDIMGYPFREAQSGIAVQRRTVWDSRSEKNSLG